MFENRTTSFKILGYEIQVTTGFFLTAFLLLAGYSSNPFVLIGVVLVELLLFIAHEAGHALSYRLFNVESYIVFHALGGTTIPRREESFRSWQEIVISAAGPLLGLLPAGLFYVAWRFLSDFPDLPFASEIMAILKFGWRFGVIINLLNLLPIFPLDGGHIVEAMLAKIFPKSAVQIISAVGLILSVTLLAIAFKAGMIWTGIIMLQFVIINWERFRRSNNDSE